MPAVSQSGESWLIDISADDDRSNAIRVGGFERGSFQAPAEITAANFQIEVSNDGTNYAVVKGDDAGTDLAAVALAANKVFPIHANVFKAKWARMFVSSGQAADRTFTVHLAGN